MNLFRSTLYVGLLVLLLAVAIFGISTAQEQLNRMRGQYELTETAPLENAPPIVAFATVALGGFRGLVADYLWLRTNRLQEQQNYFEMVQLASWIVTFNDPEDRWRWVRRGVELIRDEALLYNPSDPELYKELAWIYLHKLGQDMDDANRYYKTQLALDMTSVLGEPPYDWDQFIAAPPDEPTLRATLGDKCSLWTDLAAAGTTFEDFERRFRAKAAFPDGVDLKGLSPAERTTLEYCLRRRWLTEAYKLDPARVKALNQKFGPLEWRLPQAHGIYWAMRGLESAPGQKDLNCERMVFQGLNSAFQVGRILFLKDTRTLETTPNIGIIDAVNQSYLDSMAKHEENSSIKGGYENFLIDSVVILYTFGKREKATEYLRKARAMYPGPKFRRDLDDFALSELADDMGSASQKQAQAAVQGYLMQSCYSFALGDDERAAVFELIAKKLWQKYMKEVGTTDTRRGLPPYDNMKKNTIDQSLERFPPPLANRLRLAIGRPAAPPAGTPMPP